jgi:symplekin
METLVPALFQSLTEDRLNEAINVVRSRWLELGKRTAMDAVKAVTGEDDNDDYDPLATFVEDTDQILDRLDDAPPNGVSHEIAVTSFNLPPPPPLTDQDRDEYSKSALTRVFGTLANLDKETKPKSRQAHEHGFNRLAAVSASHDREGWITLLTRLATRAAFDLDDKNSVKQENEDRSLSKKGQVFNLSAGIRESLLNYVMESFRSRMEVAIIWLNEEWYSDRLQQKQNEASGNHIDSDDLPNYWFWTLRLLDGMMPYFDVKDGRILIRLLSEVPAINRDVLDRVRKIAEDPERVAISTNALLYLIMFKPPVRELAIDCVEQMWRENSDAKSATKKILVKWRPAVLEEGEVKVEGDVKAGN